MIKVFRNVLLLLLLANSARANVSVLSLRPAFWSAFIIEHHFTDRFYLRSEFRNRVIFRPVGMSQRILRPSAHFELFKGFEISAGYSYINHYPDPFLDASKQREQNIWEQIETKSEIGKVILQSRTRLEHRFLRIYDNRLQDFLPYVRTNHRLRIRLLLAFKNKHGNWGFYNEAFFNPDSYMAPFPSQNWTSFFYSFKIGERVNIKPEFMIQYRSPEMLYTELDPIARITFVLRTGKT